MGGSQFVTNIVFPDTGPGGNNKILESEFFNSKVISSFNEFAKDSEIILANRMDDELIPYQDKVYTKDLFGKD